ncbi:MAG: hypothetical protein IT204_08060 [Fimbriimonadaceae bacterium]|nr:hypothetical protein [Fimbriimonadaceae bacterium]
MSEAPRSRPAVRPGEWRWALALAATLAVLTTLPYVFASARTPSGQHYLGFLFNPDEPNVHLSWIRQAAEGSSFFRNEFTSEPHTGHFFNLFMLGCGRLAAAVGLSPYEVWALARLLAVALLGPLVYALLAAVTARRQWRQLGLAVVLLSSGAGWFQIGSGPETPFNPLLLLSVGLLLLGVRWGERAVREDDSAAAVGAVLCALLLRGTPRPDWLLLAGAVTLAAPWRTTTRRPLRDWTVALLWLAALPPAPMESATRWLGLGCAGLGLLAYGWLTQVPGPDLRRWRWVALVAGSLAAWLVLGRWLQLDPIDVEPDLVMPEAITFLSAYLNPLFTVSVALLLVSLVCGELAIRTQRYGYAAVAGLAGLLLANIHTYDAVPLLLTLGVYTLWQSAAAGQQARGGWLALGLIVLLTVPAVGYQKWLIGSDALYAAKANTVTATPPLPTMLVSYGLLLPLALVGVVRALRQRRWPGRFLVVWLVVHAGCIYLPSGLFPFQRKMIEGFHVVLAVLATLGLWRLTRLAATMLAVWRTRTRLATVGAVWAVRADLACRRATAQRQLALLGLLALLPSNVLFVMASVEAVHHNNAAKLQAALMPPFYLPQAEVEAWDWMRQHLPRDAVVACLPTVGSYLPGRAGFTVYCGHWAETIGFGEKLRELNAVLQDPAGNLPGLLKLSESGVTHLYYGTYELGSYRLPKLAQCKLVYPARLPVAPDLPAVAIYRIDPTAPIPSPAPTVPAGADLPSPASPAPEPPAVP